MPRDPRYDILFEPVKIGPKTARNRFYQVPHCSGMGYGLSAHAGGHARHEGRGRLGRGVTPEYCSIHPTCDDTPFAHCRLWDDRRHPRPRADDRVRCIATARSPAVELWHGGRVTMNRYSRQAPAGAAPSRVGLRRAGAGARAWTSRTSAISCRWHREAARARRRGRLRHRLCLCRPRLPADAVPLPPHQRPHRRVWRQPGEPRPAPARDDRGDARRPSATAAAVAVRLAVDELAGRRRHHRASARAARSWPCWPSCRTCGTSMSATATTTPAPPASPRRAAQEPYIAFVKS